jgi:carbonic anhydrase
MHRCVILVLAFALSLPLAAQGASEADGLWKMMLTGNLTFMGGDISFKDLDEERKPLARGQVPPVLVLACSDSRVPPELVFNQSLGALFVVRTAGNIADEFGLASIEYAVSRDPQWTKLIVVLSHENCGAVVEAMKPEEPPTPPLVALVNRIRRSFVMGQTDLPNAIKANAKAAAAALTADSTIVRKAVMDKRVKIIPAYYELLSGRVREIE